MHSLIKKPLLRSCLIALAFGCVLPAAANARESVFDKKSEVSDKDLSTMRGGFIDINGMLIDFNFLSRVQVGLTVQSNVSLETANLIQAAQTSNQIQDLLSPQFIQNIDSNTLISIQQALNLTIVNPELLNQMSQMHQLDFLQANVAH